MEEQENLVKTSKLTKAHTKNLKTKQKRTLTKIKKIYIYFFSRLRI